MLRSTKQLARYLFRFATDSQYRNMVLGVFNEHLGRSTREAARDASPGSDQFEWARGKTVYLVGGCELEYIKDQLESFGMNCKYSFELATAQDPFAELSNLSSPSLGAFRLRGFQPVSANGLGRSSCTADRFRSTRKERTDPHAVGRPAPSGARPVPRDEPGARVHLWISAEISPVERSFGIASSRRNHSA